MDISSAILVLRLQIEDNETILTTLNCTEGDDYNTALTLHLSELRQRLQILQDHSIAYGPLGATGREIIDGVFGLYHMPSNNQQQHGPKQPTSRVSAQTSPLVNIQIGAPHKAEARSAGELVTVTRNLLQALDIATSKAQNDSESDIASETSHNAVEDPVSSETPAELSCIACLTTFSEESLIQCPCEHTYCDQCLAEHFKASIQSLAFPPSCCGQIIPLELAGPHLNIRLLASYNTKKAAIENPGVTHCALLSCQARIAPENISNGRATCTCKTITCVMCKFVAHGDACPEDTDRAALLSIAVAEGLRACYRCGELYERIHGCNHMKCTNCSAQFCYNCGKQWGTCQCGDYRGQAMQLVRTGEVADNRAASGQLLPENCPHERWIRVSNPAGQCHQCGFDAGHYLERCFDCHIYSCTRCRMRSQ